MGLSHSVSRIACTVCNSGCSSLLLLLNVVYISARKRAPAAYVYIYTGGENRCDCNEREAVLTVVMRGVKIKSYIES